MKLHSKNTAVLAAMLGAMALAGAGVAHAVDDEPPLECSQDARGNTICHRFIHQFWTTDEGSRVHVEQTMQCTSSERNRNLGPVDRAAHKDGHQGADIDCSPEAPR
jgi:hypothetical protein